VELKDLRGEDGALSPELVEQAVSGVLADRASIMSSNSDRLSIAACAPNPMRASSTADQYVSNDREKMTANMSSWRASSSSGRPPQGDFIEMA
jgi:hypothetical protein